MTFRYNYGLWTPKYPLFELPMDVNLSLLQMDVIFLQTRRRLLQRDFTSLTPPSGSAIFEISPENNSSWDRVDATTPPHQLPTY